MTKKNIFFNKIQVWLNNFFFNFLWKLIKNIFFEMDLFIRTKLGVDKCMFHCPFHIIRAFMSDFQHLPHLLCRGTLRHPEKFIHVQGRGYNIFGNAIILHTLILYISQFIKRFHSRHTINNMHRYIRSIYNCIPNASVNRLNKDPHSDFPELVGNSHQKTLELYLLKPPQQKANSFQPWIENLTRIQVLTLMPIVRNCFGWNTRGEVNWISKSFSKTSWPSNKIQILLINLIFIDFTEQGSRMNQ